MRLILGAVAGLALLAACGEPQRVGANVHFACDRPETDTTGWRRVPGPFPGYTMLVPASLRPSAAGRDALWNDSARSVRVFRRPWGAAQFENRNASRSDYNSCWTRIAGMRTYIVVRRLDGGYQVTGWFRRPTGMPAAAGLHDGIISGASLVEEDQAVFLRMIRSLEPAAEPRP